MKRQFGKSTKSQKKKFKKREDMKKFLLVFLLVLSAGFAETLEEESPVDCLILQDENSIICKYVLPRAEEDKEIKVQWIDPKGELSRERNLLIPAGHGSIYDFRYVNGRMPGIWTFKVFDSDKISEGNFEIK